MISEMMIERGGASQLRGSLSPVRKYDRRSPRGTRRTITRPMTDPVLTTAATGGRLQGEEGCQEGQLPTVLCASSSPASLQCATIGTNALLGMLRLRHL